MHQGSPHIPAGLLMMPAEQIADALASPQTYPDGAAAGLRMLGFYLSYARKHLSPLQLRRLERARKLLAAHVDRQIKQEERQQAA